MYDWLAIHKNFDFTLCVCLVACLTDCLSVCLSSGSLGASSSLSCGKPGYRPKGVSIFLLFRIMYKNFLEASRYYVIDFFVVNYSCKNGKETIHSLYLISLIWVTCQLYSIIIHCIRLLCILFLTSGNPFYQIKLKNFAGESSQ